MEDCFDLKVGKEMFLLFMINKDYYHDNPNNIDIHTHPSCFDEKNPKIRGLLA